jgi:AraC-like DNA-binding protein
MAYLSRRPCAPLDLWVESVWTSSRPQGLAHTREWGLPTGRADLVVPLDRTHLVRFAVGSDQPVTRLRGGVLQGAMLQPVLRCTATASVVVGAHFRAAGLAGFFAEPAGDFAGSAVALDLLWPGFTDDLQTAVVMQGALHDPARRLQVFERALLARLRQRSVASTNAAWAGAVAWPTWATQRLAAGAAVRDVQRDSGWSPNSFAQRYRAACGLLPKQHAAVMRFQKSLQLAQAGQPWAQVAAEAGYADQAHLNRSFRQLAGLAPGQVRRQATEFSNHLSWR